ncbi:MAG TPA: response regulator [Bryobacteraceae bacterium]|nr:response regulator [Bryobacteraceae bacterium]
MQIIVVEDSASDVYLLKQALNEHIGSYQLQVIKDGTQAIAFIESSPPETVNPPPDLFILDLNLPGYHGLDVLRRLKQHQLFKTTPVVIFTSSSAPDERQEGKRLGANCFLRKPTDLDAFIAVGECVKRCYEDAVNR